MAVGVTTWLPTGGCEPLHAPLAVQVVTLVDDHASVALCPSVMVVGETVRFSVAVGGGSGELFSEVPKVQLTKPEA